MRAKTLGLPVRRATRKRAGVSVPINGPWSRCQALEAAISKALSLLSREAQFGNMEVVIKILKQAIGDN